MRSILFISILVISLILTVGTAGAQGGEVVFGDTLYPQNATAINLLKVEGTYYDVVFDLGVFPEFSFGEYPGSYTFNNAADAEAAVDKINLALNNAEAEFLGEVGNSSSATNYGIAFESFHIDSDTLLKVWRAIKDTADGWISLGSDTVNYHDDQVTFALFTFNPTSLEEGDFGVVPQDYKLLPNHPNPFNPSTTIQYYLPRAGEVTVRIYDVNGQLIKTLVDSRQSAGQNSVIWNSRNNAGQRVASGVYFYILNVEGLSLTRKMLLTK